MVYDLTMLKTFYAAYSEKIGRTERTAASDDTSGENFVCSFCMMGIK